MLRWTNRTKTCGEILRDATLVAYFSFDNNSTCDQGPLRINGSFVANSTFVPGRVGQGLEIKNITESTFEVHGLVLLGTSYRTISFAIWIRPYVHQQATIIHLSSQPDGSGWCLAVLGLTKTGQLIAISYDGSLVKVMGPVVPIHSWTHAVVTYSYTHGMLLYVNGTRSVSTSPFKFSSSGQPMHLFLGSPFKGIGCVSMYGSFGLYSGAVDELRVYSRELSAADVAILANH